MKQTITVIVLFILLSVQGHAQTGTKKEKIKYLFSLMRQDSLINKTFDAMSSSMATQMSALFKDSLYIKAGVNYSDKYAGIMAKSLEVSKENARKLLNEDMVDIYDKYFSAEEIDDFIVFYKSKSGQKMVDRIPDITKDVMTAMMTKYQPNLQQSIRELTEEMTKEMQKQQQ